MYSCEGHTWRRQLTELLRIHLVFRPACSVWLPTVDVFFKAPIKSARRNAWLHAFFWQYQFPNQHLISKLFGQIRFQRQKSAIWQGLEKMCYGITWLVENYRKSVVFLQFLLGRGTSHILDWHVAWLQFFPFLTYGKNPCGWYSHYLSCFASVWLTPDFVHIFAHSWGMDIYSFRHQT